MRPRYPAVALGLLAMADSLLPYALLVLGPDLARTLGVGPGTVATIAVLVLLATAIAVLPLAAAVRHGRRRAAVSVASGATWAAGSAAAAVATGPWALAAVAGAGGAATASSRAIHPALIADVYDDAARVRALAVHQGLDASGVVAAPVLVAGLSAAGLTWRGVFLAVGAVALVTALAALRLRDPGVRPTGGGAPQPLRPDPATAATAMEQARAVLLVPSLRRIVVGGVVAGVFLAPLLTHLLFFLEGRWGLDATERGGVLAALGLVSVAAVALLGAEAERRLARGPGALLAAVWPLPALAGAAFAVAVLADAFALVLAACAVGFACLPLLRLGVNAVLVTVAAPGARVAATALAAVAATGAGGLGGLLLLAGLREAVGADGAILALTVPAVAAALVLRAAGRHADADLARMLREEARAEAAASAPGGTAPRLQADGLVAAYDHRRVLDVVDVRVGDGEALAVLGTNGAGKSTLLRVLAGLTPPVAGRVRLQGRDVTSLAAERRARLGLAFVPSAGATFGPLTVREGLRFAARAAGHGAGSRAAADAALERFPALVARAGVRAVALSEGERRLLALAQALLLRPSLLLLDEPTRGLAPPAAEAVLAVARDVAAGGAAVVVVEQSVDAAAAVATRACFLERGRVRFDGPIGDLRGRHDLLRPVFLGAAAGTPG